MTCTAVFHSHQPTLSHALTCRGAGTDADVFIEMFGDKGAVGKTRLETSADNFERNHVRDYCIHSLTL